jgi:hypothetical protein
MMPRKAPVVLNLPTAPIHRQVAFPFIFSSSCAAVSKLKAAPAPKPVRLPGEPGPVEFDRGVAMALF